MVNSKKLCQSIETKRKKTWLYEEYYVGDMDLDNRKSGYGVNTWSGAKSQEYYDGCFTCDTMHGSGEYHWKYHGEDGTPCTYEGHFYNNCMHGYGVISFPDGKTFRGLFNNNMRWGPGIQSHAALRDDVGLWRGTQLIRLTWRPLAPSVVPDFTANSIGRAIVEGHRRLLINTIRHIGETNSALDLLKKCGADPRLAVEDWKKLYPKHCTDVASPLCQIEIFDRDYYKDRIESLEEIHETVEFEGTQAPQDSQETLQKETYFAWNNNNIIINMMKHCYQHEKQRDNYEIDLACILSGPRKCFKMAGVHEADCRTLLLTSYLGYIANVAELINKHNVDPNVADMQGNTALMYATCAEQIDVINFLVDAGADIDSFNDSCCTALGVALLRFTCVVNDIPPYLFLQSLLPPPIVPAPPSIEPKAFEWLLTRELTSQGTAVTLMKSSSKTVRSLSQKKVKSLMSIKDQNMAKRKTDTTPAKALETEYDSDNSLSENKKVYSNANRDFTIKVNDIFQQQNTNIIVPYLFEINDMIMEIEALEEEPKKAPDKNIKKVASKVIKDTIKTSKELIWPSSDKVEYGSENSIEKQKRYMLEEMKLTIFELLAKGAKPQLVRCPQPALVIAISSNCSDLIKHLVQYGADVNEIYPQIHGYSPLDIAVSRPYTLENIEIVKALLESGANAKRCIYYEDVDSSDITVYEPRKPGPTLLHAVLARKPKDENEEDIRQHLLNLLLDYNCDPTLQFKGRSAIDMVMTNILLFDVFIRNPNTNLNCVINDLNQNVLLKMFWLPFFKNVPSNEKIQTLTNLLLYGADPLLPCQNGEEKFDNIFVFAKNTLLEFDNTQVTQDQKGKKVEKPKKDEKLTTKSVGKMVTDDKEDYKQAIELVTECARLLYIRWLQGKLIKELIYTIDKFKHRTWNVILNECKSKKRIGLWITPHRCLEIWNILVTERKIYNDHRILKHLLSIVTFLAWRFYSPKNNEFKASSKVTSIVRDLVDKDVYNLLKEYKSTSKVTKEEMHWNIRYVKPELDRDDQKFKVCFECALPLKQDNILCSVCKLVSFCSYECMKDNIERIGCHPCSDELKAKYFQSPNYSLPSSADSTKNK